MNELFGLVINKAFKLLSPLSVPRCNDATRTEIALGTNYETVCANGELINFLAILPTVCYGSNNGGLFFKMYKNVVVMKSLNNFSNA